MSRSLWPCVWRMEGAEEAGGVGAAWAACLPDTCLDPAAEPRTGRLKERPRMAEHMDVSDRGAGRGVKAVESRLRTIRARARWLLIGTVIAVLATCVVA